MINEIIDLLREQNQLLEKILRSVSMEIKIENIKAMADDVIVSRSKRGMMNDSRRYYQ